MPNKFIIFLLILILNNFIFICSMQLNQMSNNGSSNLIEQDYLKIFLELFFEASKNGKLSFVQELSKDVDINSRNEDGETALILAVKNRQEAVVRYLIALGADLYVQDKNKQTAVHYAKQSNCKTIIKMIRRAMSTIPYNIVGKRIIDCVDSSLKNNSNETMWSIFDLNKDLLNSEDFDLADVNLDHTEEEIFLII